MSLFLVVLSAVLALGSVDPASSGHGSLTASATQTDSAICPPPGSTDDLLGGQPSYC